MKRFNSLFKENLYLDCEDLIQCFYNLSSLEFDIYCALLKMDEAKIDGTVIKIQEYMGRKEKTMINRSLKKLFEQGLVSRQAETVNSSKDNDDQFNQLTPKRGYYYTYKPLPLDALIGELRERLNKFHEVASIEIDNIKSKFKEKLEASDELKKIKAES